MAHAAIRLRKKRGRIPPTAWTDRPPAITGRCGSSPPQVSAPDAASAQHTAPALSFLRPPDASARDRLALVAHAGPAILWLALPNAPPDTDRPALADGACLARWPDTRPQSLTMGEYELKEPEPPRGHGVNIGWLGPAFGFGRVESLQNALVDEFIEILFSQSMELDEKLGPLRARLRNLFVCVVY